MSVRIRVDEAFCELHGMCVDRAPDVFRFGDGDTVEHEGEVSGDETVEAVRDAQFLCPAQAIEVSG
jgi:ferredoxin